MASHQQAHSSSESDAPLVVDVEKATSSAVADGKNRRVKEAAGLLLAFSLFAFVEGVVRMTTGSNPAVDFDFGSTNNGTAIPGGVLLAGGVAEVFFALAGILVALYSLMFDLQSPALTTGLALVQFVLGWFVFITYAIAAPILRARFGKDPSGLFSPSEFRSLVVLGQLLGGITFCYAVQGGQFITILNLLSAQKGLEWNKKKSALRATIWSINMILAGFSTIFVGSMLVAKDFSDEGGPFGVPPHVVWFPSLSIVTGLLMVAYGVVCQVASKKSPMIDIVAVLFPIVLIMMSANFSWVFGKVPGLGEPIAGALQHIGLIFSIVILPAYHAIRSHHDP